MIKDLSVGGLAERILVRLVKLERLLKSSGVIFRLKLKDSTGEILGLAEESVYQLEWESLVGKPVYVSGFVDWKQSSLCLLLSSLKEAKEADTRLLDIHMEDEKERVYLLTLKKIRKKILPPYAKVIDQVMTPAIIEGLRQVPFFDEDVYDFPGGALVAAVSICGAVNQMAEFFTEYDHGLYGEPVDVSRMLASVLIYLSVLPEIFTGNARELTKEALLFGPYRMAEKKVGEKLNAICWPAGEQEEALLLAATIDGINAKFPATLEAVFIKHAIFLIKEEERYVKESCRLRNEGTLGIARGRYGIIFIGLKKEEGVEE